MKIKGWDVLLGAAGWLGTVSFKDLLSYGIGIATLTLLCIRIWLAIKHRNTPPRND